MTLTQVAGFTQKFIVISIISVILGIVSFIGYRIWYANYLANLPPVEEKPEIKWGSLPTPEFPPSKSTATNFSYTIDTQSGLLSLEKFPKISKVFFIPKGVTTFLAGQRAADLSTKFSVSTQPEILSETKYKFSTADRSITVNLDTSNFQYQKDASAAASIAVPITNSTTQIAQDFKTFLSNKNLLNDELREGPVKIGYFKFNDKSLIPTDATEAQAVQISIWPKDIDKKSVVTPSNEKSLVSAIFVKSALDLENYITLDYIYWPVDQTTFTTYPLKTAEGAFNDLRSGKGVVILAPNASSASITSIKLSYFESDKYSPYLQPVYVFEGPSFIAYIPAIASPYLASP